MIHESAYVDAGARIGVGTKIWHFCHVMAGAFIGDNCSLGQGVFVGANVKIGDGCKIQNNVSLYEGVTVEDDVFLGPSCVFTNVKRPKASVKAKEYIGTLVKRGATIGANATVICGVTIGENAFVGAGAVVTKNVAPDATVVGVPAKETYHATV